MQQRIIPTEQAKAEVISGDCMKYLLSAPDASFDLILTSPPYNIGKVYEKRQSLKAYLDGIKPLLSELVRTLKPSGSLCWQVGNYVDDGEVYPLDIYFYPYFKDLGLQLRNRIIWHFEHGLHASKRLSGRYETILWFTKSDEYVFNLDDIRIPSKYPGKRHFKGDKKGQVSGNPLGKNPSDVWSVLLNDWENEIWDIPNVKSNHPEKTIHPCQFPVELVERCVLALTPDDGVVFDPFSGAGSTLIGAIKNGRSAVGTELDPTYVALTKQRLVDFDLGRLKFRPMTKPIHRPSPNDKVARVPEEWTLIR